MAQNNAGEVPNYTLVDKETILEKFKIIEGQKIRLTAEPFGLVTSISQVIHEKNLLVFEAGSDEILNQKFLNSGGCTLIGRVEGVFAVFMIKNVFEETVSGKKVYMAAIPAALFWHQRREFSRVAIDLDKTFFCKLPLISGETVDFPVLDITLSGLAVFDQACLLAHEYKRGHVFDPCSFEIEGLLGKPFGLELRNKPRIDGEQGRRIGLSFVGSCQDFATHIVEIIDKFGCREDGLSKR